MKYAALAFTIFIIAIIVLADRNSLPPFIDAFYDFRYGDKAGHFILYGLLNFFITRAFLQSFPAWPRGRAALSIGLALAVLVTLEEYSQKLFSVRTFDLFDLLASGLGLLAGSWSALRLKN